jgi:hypothetical protein
MLSWGAALQEEENRDRLLIKARNTGVKKEGRQNGL